MLICWVDDSEEQDREVFRRKMAERRRRPATTRRRPVRPPRLPRVWRRLRAEGPVHVEVPFADRIRMASVRNRRNPDILLDLVRSHALVYRFQRERRAPRRTAGSLITATEADFRYAAGRLCRRSTRRAARSTAKFDRNEQLVLSLAAQNRVEQFTVADVQRWTGWQYQKARRLLVGYVPRGVRYPGPARQVAGALAGGPDA